MAFIKSLGVAIYERVIVSYKPTLIGIGLASAVLVVDQSVAALQALPKGWAQVLASVLALGGAYLKAKAPTPPAAP